MGERAVWMPTDANGILSRIDPATNTVVSRIRVPEASCAAAVGLGAVWVTSTTHNLVSRIEPHTNTVTANIPVGPAPRFLAVGEGAVWVLNQGDGTVSRIDPLTNRVVATIEVVVPGPGGDIAVGESFVGVTAIGKPYSRIDPGSNRLVAQFVGEGGDALRIGHGSVWLASFSFKKYGGLSRPFKARRGDCSGEMRSGGALRGALPCISRAPGLLSTHVTYWNKRCVRIHIRRGGHASQLDHHPCWHCQVVDPTACPMRYSLR